MNSDTGAITGQFIDRTRQWWRAKAGFLWCLLSCHLVLHEAKPVDVWILLGLATIAIFGIGTMGHIINDWCDMADDRKAGKSNTMEMIPRSYRLLVLLTFAAIGYLPWFIGFKANLVIVLLLGFEALLFLLYSVSPIKLKKVPWMAVCMDSMYAFVVPSLFLWLSFDSTLGSSTETWLILCVVGWTFPMGLRHIFLHHISDRNNDLLSGIPNLANRFGVRFLLQVTRWVLVPVEMLFHAIFLVQVYPMSPNLALVLMLIYALLMFSVLVGKLPYLSLGLAKLPLDTYYTKVLGVVCFLFLSISNPWNTPILVGFLLMFTQIRNHPLWYRTVNGVINQVWSVGSLTVNWSVYYFRKWILNWSEERNWGRFYTKHLKEIQLDGKPSIAMFNQSYSNFSLEYLDSKFSSIGHRLFFYYGQPIPIWEKEDGHLMGQDEMLRKLKYMVLNLIKADVVDIENEQVAKSLLKKKVDLVIAHSETIGFSVLEIVRKTGIPLMLIINKTDRVMSHRNKGQGLFDYATCVVGTSKKICQDLESNGCLPEKIEYLPTFLDPELFTYQAKGFNGHVFISVGRYYSTRAPYLLLLSFRELVNEMPDAELLILGLEREDDVTQVCQVMTKALGLENHVKFLYNCSYTEVVQAMTKADVFVQHYVTTAIEKEQEGTSIAVMMAMAMGLPVVSTRNGGVAELISNDHTGLLVEELDYKEMARQMYRIASDIELRDRITIRAKKSILEEQRIGSGVEVFEGIVNRCVYQNQYTRIVAKVA